MKKLVFMCVGSDCRRANLERKAVRKQLRKEGLLGRIGKVRCQKICKGPVFGVRMNGQHEWFRLVAPQDAPALARVARGGALEPELLAKYVKKRSGKLRE